MSVTYISRVVPSTQWKHLSKFEHIFLSLRDCSLHTSLTNYWEGVYNFMNMDLEILARWAAWIDAANDDKSDDL